MEETKKRYAVVEIGTKQYQVKEDELVTLDRLGQKEGEKISLKPVLLVRDDKEIFIGTPHLDDWFVEAEVMKQIKGKKIRVAKYKAKSRYRRVKGHRQSLTVLKIKSIKKIIKKVKKS